jgi:hypothetical protein
MPSLRNDVSLTELDDAALDAAISDMQELIATRPDFAKFVATSLEEHKSERAARARADAGSGNATPEYGAFLLDSPLLTAVEKSTGRSTRIRICPVRYGLNAEDGVSNGPILSLAEQHQLDLNKTMRLQLKANDEIVKETARDMACPLLCAELGLPFPPVTNDLNALLKTQMSKPALAADGYRYELKALQKYIQKNMGGMLVSPITKRPMAGSVNYVVKARDVKDASRVKWKHKAWQPLLSPVVAPAR